MKLVIPFIQHRPQRRLDFLPQPELFVAAGVGDTTSEVLLSLDSDGQKAPYWQCGIERWETFTDAE